MPNTPREHPLLTWLRLRRTVLLRPNETYRELANLTKGTPWYATARPLTLIQHWAPDPLMPVTYCGKFAKERSTSEIRTPIGWHCRRCHRRVKRILKQRRADRATQQHTDHTDNHHDARTS